MKESKKLLVKDVAKEMDALSDGKRTRALDVMRGMLIMDQLYRSGSYDKPKKTG